MCLVTGVCLGQSSIDTEAFSVIDMWYISYCLGLFVCSAVFKAKGGEAEIDFLRKTLRARTHTHRGSQITCQLSFFFFFFVGSRLYKMYQS